MSLTSFQSRPAIDAAIYHPIGTLYQLQPSFHTQSTEPEPTAHARRAGGELRELMDPCETREPRSALAAREGDDVFICGRDAIADGAKE